VVRRLEPRLSRPVVRGLDSAALSNHSGRRHRRGDDQRSPLPQRAPARRGLRGAHQVLRKPVRPRLRRRLPAPARAGGRELPAQGPEVRHLRVHRGPT
jgi:hypothetical protein